MSQEGQTLGSLTKLIADGVSSVAIAAASKHGFRTVIVPIDIIRSQVA